MNPGVDKILALLSNPATNDLRPLKEAATLSKNGYSVTMLAWDREGGSARRSLPLVNFEIRRFALKAPYGQNPLTLLGLMMFYIWCSLNALGRGYRVIHCHDVDTLPCGVFLKLFSFGKSKLIYDMHDHPQVFLNAFPMSRILVGLAFLITRKYVDNVVVVNEAFVTYLAGKGIDKDRMTVIMNVPDIEKSVPHTRTGHSLRTLYYGKLSAQMGTRNLVSAAMDLEDVWLVLAGRGDLTPWILEVQKHSQNIRYIGWLSIEELERESDEADVFLILYPPDNINTVMSTPVKLFEAISRGIPVITSMSTYFGDYVDANRCGLCVDFYDIQSIRNAIVELRDDEELYNQLSHNALRLWEREVNWKTMESRLLSTYKAVCTAR